jgi:Na+-driven multidrug efflux pump
MVDRWQADAIWWAFPISSILSVTLAFTYYRFGNWRKARMGLPRARVRPVASTST